MITLYAFGPQPGLPDTSPFVTKAATLLKMAGLPYQTDTKGFAKAPKGKPHIDDDGERIADSTFIRWHIEKKYGLDFDRTLARTERAIAWAFEKMAEDNLYWALVHHAGWTTPIFKGPARFFESVPAPVRPLVVRMIRRKVRQALKGHGMGRHSPAEIVALAARSIDAIADQLGGKPFLMGGCALRRRRDHVRLRRRGARAAFRVPNAQSRRGARQSQALRCAHGGALLSRIW